MTCICYAIPSLQPWFTWKKGEVSNYRSLFSFCEEAKIVWKYYIRKNQHLCLLHLFIPFNQVISFKKKKILNKLLVLFSNLSKLEINLN